MGRLAGVLLRTQPDERLVAMARNGGAAPFEEIVRRHRAALLVFAGSIAPPSRAEDVVQDSLLKAYAALQDGAEPEALRAWLFRIVRNTAIDRQRGVRHHEQLDESYDGVEQPPQALARREQIASLMLAIQDLPETQREAILRRELEGRGHEEIGRALQLSPGAVRQLIYRARQALREAAGAVVPTVMVRAASMRGADEAVGGLGMAGAVKLGLAAVAVTGTIVAGASIGRHEGPSVAQALEISTPRGKPATEFEVAAVGDQPRAARERETADHGRPGSSALGPSRTQSSGRGQSVNQGGGESQHGASGDDLNEGPESGSDDLSESESESGSGSATSGDDGESSGGDTSGTGSGEATTSGEGPASSSDDGDLSGTGGSGSSSED